MHQSLRLLAHHFAKPAASAVTEYNPQRAQHTLCFVKICILCQKILTYNPQHAKHTPVLLANMPYHCPCITAATA